MTRRRMVAVALSVLGFFAIAWRTARSAAPPENMTDEILKVDDERNQALQKGDIRHAGSHLFGRFDLRQCQRRAPDQSATPGRTQSQDFNFSVFQARRR